MLKNNKAQLGESIVNSALWWAFIAILVVVLGFIIYYLTKIT